MSENKVKMSTPCRSGGIVWGYHGSSHEDCHYRLCECPCHGGIPPICDCAQNQADEEQLALLEQEAYWRGRLFPELREQIEKEVLVLHRNGNSQFSELVYLGDVLRAIRGK